MFFVTVHRFKSSPFMVIKSNVSVHGTLKLENRNWKFGLHAFVLLMNAFNFGPSFLTIVLYSVSFDSDNTFPLTLLPICNHTDRKFVSSFSNFYFLISSFKP